ncbi:methyl-accepting chemotaxis protein [Alkalimonas sp.]|uniref:methyl-accepting chemotaxis protein n=1 Tax=Alkalimonas sp. TaxID=1872453 RepID=UPI00263A8FD4|nr:methyl-accepting chemotaxis protein [Alkalimonas sp.]MCC5825641.1 HAMP domain-containing protein [Alkalimonas sp.]
MAKSAFSVGKKLTLSFGLLVVLMICVAIIVQLAQNTMSKARAAAAEKRELSILQMQREIDHLNWANELASSMLLQQPFRGQLEPTQCNFGRWYDTFRASDAYHTASPELKRALDAMDKPHRELHASAKAIVAANPAEQIRIYQQQTLQHLSEMRGYLAEVAQLFQAERDSIIAKAERSDRRAMSVVWSAMALTILAAIGLIFLLRRLIAQPMKALKNRAQQIAAGDLTGIELPVVSQDEVGMAASAFNDMQHQLHDLVAGLVKNAHQVAEHAARVSVITNETDQDLQRQAAEIEQLATAMNEMAATIAEVAKHAQNTSTATNDSEQHAEHGQQIVRRVIGAISEIASEVELASGTISAVQQESTNIGGILDTIQAIAEQTNLLALNAAIEAARAGEQGRGFAVVADEVRTLAARTQQSTTEIKTLIDRLQQSSGAAVTTMQAGVEKARSGVELADQAGAALNDIMHSVSSITDMTLQIASATEQQSTVVQEMDQNLLKVNSLTAETKERSQQADATSAELERMAQDLLAYGKRFKT